MKEIGVPGVEEKGAILGGGQGERQREEALSSGIGIEEAIDSESGGNLVVEIIY